MPRSVSAWLASVAAALGGAALAAWSWPVRVPNAVVGVVVPTAPAEPTGATAEDGERVRRLAARDPFSSSRSAPPARWRDGALGALGAMDLVTTGPSPVTTAPPRDAIEQESVPAPRRAAAVPALFGTVLGGDAPRALLRLDAGVPGARLYAEGASAGGWRVARIGPDGVTLVDARGRPRTLRIGDAPRR